MINLENTNYKGPCIYCIWSNEDTDQRMYFGQTIRYKTRVSTHESLFRNNKHSNTYLQNMINKGYTLNIGIVEICSIDQLDNREIFWINFYDSTNPNKGFNLEKGGKNIKSRIGKKFTRAAMSEKHKKRLSEVTLGIAKPYSKEHLESIRQFHKDRKGKRRKYKQIKAIDLNSNKELIFDSIVQTAEFFGKKGHTLSTHFGKQQSIVYNNYKLEKI